MEIKKELIDELLKNYQKPEDVIGENGLLKQLTKALLERAMDAELTHHLGYEKSDPAGYHSWDSRNGTTPKTLKGDFGELVIETPRDRNGTFEPQMVKKHQTRWDGFDDKILSMLCARDEHAGDPGASARDVRGGSKSDVNFRGHRRGDGGSEGVAEPAVGAGVRDCLFGCATREDAARRAGGEPRGVRGDGGWTVKRASWGYGRAATKLGVLTEIKHRGVKGILIACVDGLKRFPPAIESVFPQTQVQLCIVHLVRASLNYVNWKERKQVATDLKDYGAATATQAELELTIFQAKWGSKYQAIGKLWKENWTHGVPFFAFPAEVRKVIYTTDAVESLHMSLRKIIQTRGSFPSEEAAVKLLYLALRNVIRKWDTVQGWKQALNHFEML